MISPANEDIQICDRKISFLKKRSHIFVIIALVLGIAIGAVANIPHFIAQPIIFDNYESFATFMETPTNYYEIDGDVIIEYATVFDYNSSASEVIPDDKFIDDGYTYIDKIEIKDEKGNVLCSFRQKNRSVARYTLSDTPNRLPIKVYTYEAWNNANETCEIICSIFALFIGADAICFFYGYFSNTKKSLRKS